ncbi:MAG TPA: hypothetical protein VHM91_18305, partial [Verrucomicrobiales bacterium]|nr:hypothetical protein [Verrucomicrobiales bacterium]
AQLVIRAVNDHPTEVFRVKAVRFGRMQGEFDRDSDGVSDADELSAGTDPFDAGSFLKVTHYKNGNSISVTFPTIRDRSYRVLTSDDLVHWTQENPNPIVGDGGVQGYSVNNGGVARRFICVQVKRGLNAFP